MKLIFIYIFSLLDEDDTKKITLVRPNQLMFHESEMDKGMGNSMHGGWIRMEIQLARE